MGLCNMLHRNHFSGLLHTLPSVTVLKGSTPLAEASSSPLERKYTSLKDASKEHQRKRG